MSYSFKKLGNLIVVALKSLGSFFKCKVIPVIVP